MKQFYMYVNYM